MVNEYYSNRYEPEAEIPKGAFTLFANYYRCAEDGSAWMDCGSSTCDSKCPSCAKEIKPYKSLDL